MNKSAVKEYALECSKVVKCGRFTRVGQDFLDELEADFEWAIKSIEHKVSVSWPSEVPCDMSLVDAADTARIKEVFRRFLVRLIQRKVEMQPSCGVTMGRTK